VEGDAEGHVEVRLGCVGVGTVQRDADVVGEGMHCCGAGRKRLGEREGGTGAAMVIWGQKVANVVIFNCRPEGVSHRSSRP
jgi:hypothetical protein